MAKTQNIRLDFSDAQAQKLGRHLLYKITKAIKSQKTTLEPIPGATSFKKIDGTTNTIPFSVEYVEHKAERGEPRKELFVTYDNYEFAAPIMEVGDYYNILREFIEKKYMYDLNSKRYVPRPKIPTMLKMILEEFHTKTK